MWRWTCSAALLLVLGIAAAEETKPVAVPFKLTDTKHLLVRVKLNGKGPFNLILDTGAPAVFITKAVAKKADVEPDKDGWGKIKQFDLEGGLAIPNTVAKVEDPFQLKGMNGLGLAGVEIHGMLGYNLIAKFKITYDLTSDKLLFEALKFDPPAVPSFGRGGQPGGLEFLGSIMKLAGPLLGMNGPPERKPRGFLGCELAESEDGVTVKSVLPGSPADKAGIRPGDRIAKLYQNKVDLVSDVVRVAEKKMVADQLILTVIRGHDEKKVTVQLGKGL